MLAFIHYHIVESIRFTLRISTIEHIRLARVFFCVPAAIFIRHIFHIFSTSIWNHWDKYSSFSHYTHQILSIESVQSLSTRKKAALCWDILIHWSPCDCINATCTAFHRCRCFNKIETADSLNVYVCELKYQLLLLFSHT